MVIDAKVGINLKVKVIIKDYVVIKNVSDKIKKMGSILIINLLKGIMDL